MADGGEEPKDDGTNQKRKRTESSSSDLGVPSWVAGASPPRFVGLEEIMKAAVNMDKMALAHEIALNPDFQLNASSPPSGSLEQRVHDAMHLAFWDSLKEQIESNPPKYEHAFSLLAEIKESLHSLLLPHHTRLKSEIDEHLDLALLQQQCKHQCLDFLSVSNYILSVMVRLCAPARDQKLKELKSCTEIVPLFKGIFEVLDLMKLDMANFTLSSFRPTIQQNSIEYEREKFDQCLIANPVGLRHTQAWLSRAFETWQETNSEQLPAPKRTDEAGPSYRTTHRAEMNDILSLAYWEVLEWSDDRAFPETLLVDQARLFDLRNRCLQLIITTAAVMSTCNAAGRDVSDMEQFKTQLKDTFLLLLADCEQRNVSHRLRAVAEQAVKEVNAALRKLNLSEIDDSRSSTKDAIRNQIMQLQHTQQPVRKLIRDRVRGFIVGVVTSPSASPIKLPHGLSLIQSELAKLSGTFLRLVSHNRQVFTNHYDDIMLQVIGAQQHQEQCLGAEDSVQNEQSSSE